jgi:hypothetical protein
MAQCSVHICVQKNPSLLDTAAVCVPFYSQIATFNLWPGFFRRREAGAHANDRRRRREEASRAVSRKAASSLSGPLRHDMNERGEIPDLSFSFRISGEIPVKR